MTELARCGLVLVAILSSSRADAQQAEDPEALISKGIELRRQGHDLRAEGYFRRAYQLAPTARATAQLGLVELALGDYVACERYLSDALAADDTWVRSYQKVLDDSRVTARAHLLQIVVTDAPPGTSATVEKARRVELGADGVLWMSPEATVVVFTATGYQTTTTTVSGQAGTVQRLAIRMIRIQVAAKEDSTAAPPPNTPSAQTPPEESTAHSKSILRWTGVGVAAAGVVAGAVGVALAISGNSKRDDIESVDAGGKPYNPADDNWQSLQHEGIGFMIAGAVAIAGGATLFVLGRHDAKPVDGVALAPAFGRNGFGVAGRF